MNALQGIERSFQASTYNAMFKKVQYILMKMLVICEIFSQKHDTKLHQWVGTSICSQIYWVGLVLAKKSYPKNTTSSIVSASSFGKIELEILWVWIDLLGSTGLVFGLGIAVLDW